MSVSNDIKQFSIQTANKYLYDYSKRLGARVGMVSGFFQPETIFNKAYADDSNSTISWKKATDYECTPALVLIKTVNGEVIDVFCYIAE